MTQEELNKVLEAHKHYLAQDCEKWGNMRADLSGADLSGAYLGGADLRRADLAGADLRGADLEGADLAGADLIEANLTRANLRGAYLEGADLEGADLTEANLTRANLRGAYLRDANLREVKYNETTAFFALACPEEGDFIAWKKIGSKVIIKLRIPAEAKRSSATSRKCRCEYAEVLELQNLDGTPYKYDSVVNCNYVGTIYKVGEIVRPDSWDEDRWRECSHGIHFFITREEAVRY